MKYKNLTKQISGKNSQLTALAQAQKAWRGLQFEALKVADSLRLQLARGDYK